MANALRKVANYLGLMDDPEVDSAQELGNREPHVRLPGCKNQNSRSTHISAFSCDYLVGADAA